MTNNFEELKSKFADREVIRITKETVDSENFDVTEYVFSDNTEIACTFYSDNKLRTCVFENEDQNFDSIKYTFDPSSGNKMREEFYDNGVLLTRAYYKEGVFVEENQIIGVGDVELEVSPKQIASLIKVLKM